MTNREFIREFFRDPAGTIHKILVAKAVEARTTHLLAEDWQPLCDKSETREASTFDPKEFAESPWPCAKCARVQADQARR